MSKKIRLAIVGCGGIARRHAHALQGDARAEIAVLYDPDGENAGKFRDAFAPAARTASSFDEAIGEAKLDAVILCSPNARHYEQTCAALDRGLHVLCEKPLALRREEIVDIMARTAASGRIVSVAHQRRYWSRYVAARRELTENASHYGPLREIHLFLSESWSQGIVGTWRNDPSQNFGYFGDAGIHLVDMIHFITGLQVKRLFAVSDRRGREVEIVTRVLAEMTGGVGLAAHFVGDAQQMCEDLHFHCRDADLLLRDNRLWCSQAGRSVPIANLPIDGDPALAFLDAIESGRPTVSPPDVALPIWTWNNAVMASIKSGG